MSILGWASTFMDIRIAAASFCQESTFLLNYSIPTIRRYKHAIRSYTEFSNITQCSEISEENVRAYFLNGLVTRKWKASSFSCIRITLNVFCKWCIAKQYISFNPVDTIQRPKKEKSLPIRLTKQESLRLLDIINNYPYKYRFIRYRNHAMFSMFLFAGLRKSELLNLKLTDVDIENLTIFVRWGKGKKDRIIPMSHTLAQSLTEYLRERKEHRVVCSEFFATYRGKCKIDDRSLTLLVNELKKASKLQFSVHKLRHTFATLMIEGGCDIYSLSEMMGHTDISTTTIYLSVSAEHLRGQMVKHPLNVM